MGEPLTRGYKTCRVQWVFEHFIPPRGFVTGDTDVAPYFGTFHTATDVAKYASLLSPHRAGAPLMTCSPLRGLRTS